MSASGWGGALTAFEAAQLVAGASEATITVQVRRLRQFARDVGGEPWEVTPGEVTTWLAGLPGVASSIKAYRGALMAFYRWGIRCGFIVSSPVQSGARGTGAALDSRWRDALVRFEAAQRRKGVADGTIANRAKHLQRFAYEIGSAPWAVTGEQLRDCLDSLQVAESYRLSLRSTLRAFYRWGRTDGRIDADPSAPVGMSPLELGIPAGWAEQIRAFRGFLRANGRPETTVRLRMEQIERLARDHASLQPFAITLDDLLEWLAGKRWATETRRSMCAALRAFYRWAEDTGRIAESPARKLPSVKPTAPAPRPAAADDYAAALARADDRERLALRLAAELGMRRAEVAAVHSRDLIEHADFAELVVIGKGQKRRVLPLTADLATAIRARGDGYVFPGQDRGHISPAYLGKLITQLLPDGVTMHALRHRFATLAYGIDRDVFTVQQLLGHSSPATTQRYVLVPETAKRRLVEMVAGM